MFTSSVDCGLPVAPQHGSLERYTNTTESSEVFYSCDPGLVPDGRMRAVCTGYGWSPNPADLSCTEGMLVAPALASIFTTYKLYDETKGSVQSMKVTVSIPNIWCQHPNISTITALSTLKAMDSTSTSRAHKWWLYLYNFKPSQSPAANVVW